MTLSSFVNFTMPIKYRRKKLTKLIGLSAHKKLLQCSIIISLFKQLSRYAIKVDPELLLAGREEFCVPEIRLRNYHFRAYFLSGQINSIIINENSNNKNSLSEAVECCLGERQSFNFVAGPRAFFLKFLMTNCKKNI